ncbi:uncharacterized protein LOC114977157 [Acropora millepora]|uniref:uncharacterized protein LOC114977157 n=1 Tax=Acropora millepora TaxID=45264 RepID=UPI001CF3BC9F|nr:uncharacterized protein LOC114977157 [Acropora millepora]
MLTIDSAHYTKSYGKNYKWCVEKQGIPLEFDLMYPRFITRIDVEFTPRPQRSSNVRFYLSVDKINWSVFEALRSSPRGKISYVVKPYRARYIHIHTKDLPFKKSCFKLKLFGCSDEIQSLGLWSDTGRIKTSWIKTLPGSPQKSKLRVLEPGQAVFCAPRSSRDTREFFRLDMQKVYAVSRIVFLGGMHNNGKCHRKESDRSIELRYSLDDVIWGLYGTYGFRPLRKHKLILTGGGVRYEGLTIYYEEEYQCIGILDIMPTIFAKILNIYELGRGGHNCFALDLFGNEPGKPEPDKGQRKPGCDAPLGMESKRIKDSQLKVSSFNPSGLTMRASRARLHVFGGWCTKSIENSEWSGRKYFVPKEYLEIDLLTEKFIDGFATQGHADINNPRWVTGYVVHYSLDAFSWDVISMQERERFFAGNKNHRDVVRHYLNPRIRARHIRFVPVTWHKGICMRVEIYGCSAGDSVQNKLEKKLLEINKELVQVERTFTGLHDAPGVRNKFNIHYAREVARCGISSPIKHHINPQYYSYIKLLLDFDKTKWVQHSFKKEFKASGNINLILHEFRVLKSRSAKHFTCHAILKDGTELYRHHVLTAKPGAFGVPPDLKPHFSHRAKYKIDDGLFEIPQIIVQQRVDPTIDGGMPLWGKPAVVYASGPVASIGVMILGIRDYPFLEPRSFLPDRLWTLYYLGFTQRDPDYASAYTKCVKLAMAKGYDHFLLWSDHCFSSYSMPANLQIKYRPEKKLRTWPEEEYRTFSLPYFIKGLKEFDRYEIAWYKLKPGSRNTWIKLFRYKVKDTQRQTSLLYALETYSDDDLFKFFRSRGRFRAYDKAYYGDFFAPLHVLEIDKMELQDLGTYKVTVKHLKSGAWSEKMIELRHEEEPRISLPETFGACLHTPTEMQLTLQDDNFRDPNKWSITWYHVKESRRAPRTRTLLSKGTTTLRVERPTLKMSGDAFEVDVKNQYGFARGVSRIVVTQDVPIINWVTESPHLAAKDFSDTLEVKIDNDKTLTKVDWYHNGTLIDRNAEGFAFPGEKHGALSLRKKLKLTRMSFTAGGTYRVVAVGKYCQYEKTIQVQVVVNPRLVVNPHAVYMRVYEGFDKIKIDVTVKGGVPKPEFEHLQWTKGDQLLYPSRYGRILLHTTLTKDEDWYSSLTIKDLKASDTSDYTFTVKTGPAITTMTRSLVVLPKHEYFTRPKPVQKSYITTAVPQSGKSMGCVKCSWNFIFFHIQSYGLAVYYLLQL